MNDNMVLELKEVLRQIKARELVVDTRRRSYRITTPDGKVLLEELGLAMHAFETTKESDSNYFIIVNELNKLVNLAFVNRIFLSGDELTKRVVEYEEKCKNLEDQLKKKDQIIDAIRSERDESNAKNKLYEKYLPHLNKTEESEVTEDGSS